MDKENMSEREFPLFSSLSKKQWKELQPFISRFTVQRGNSLFQQGAPALGVYLLCDGEVEQHYITPGGKKIIFNLTGSGKTIGTASLFNKENHISTAEVISKTAKVGFLERNNFFNFMQSNPAILFDLARRIATQAMAFKLKLAETSYGGSKQRLVRLLLAGRGSGIKLTRRRLGRLAGVTYKTTVQVLGDLEERNLIETEGHCFFLKNERKLTDLANQFPFDFGDEVL